jgi:hypothetical protein
MIAWAKSSFKNTSNTHPSRLLVVAGSFFSSAYRQMTNVELTNTSRKFELGKFEINFGGEKFALTSQ